MGTVRVSGTQAQQATIADALRRCTFDFDRLLPGLRAKGLDHLGVYFAALDPGIAGLASQAGWIQVSDGLSGEEAEGVFLVECGHIVDFFLLTDTQRQAIYNVFHPNGPDNHPWWGNQYWDEVGEGYTESFCWGFSDLRPANPGYTHDTTEATAAAVRAIIGDGKPPIPPAPPKPPVDPPKPPVDPPKPPPPPPPPIPPPPPPPAIDPAILAALRLVSKTADAAVVHQADALQSAWLPSRAVRVALADTMTIGKALTDLRAILAKL